MDTEEVANRLIALCREGKFHEAIDELYAKEIVSNEPNETTQGFESVRAKTEKFEASIQEVHSSVISDPLIAKDHFACIMDIDATYKEHGRMSMSEICVYEVKDGKIIKDTFFYNM
ncbi:nuclear transport factor 2 family protein [Pedobacter insulae]|uniref:SnoaL-like domain-containing protein n=1 Tax=Pedobacter insulae TaxID=414048 RepID=A0A1I3AEJ4_9SPHI|nr:nuclear transport factor 2 family protein [Pedobacter insulae]SFH48522.1 SnoaL-like domain-containing protein [Pedobacter insulae]